MPNVVALPPVSNPVEDEEYDATSYNPARRSEYIEESIREALLNVEAEVYKNFELSDEPEPDELQIDWQHVAIIQAKGRTPQATRDARQGASGSDYVVDGEEVSLSEGLPISFLALGFVCAIWFTFILAQGSTTFLFASGFGGFLFTLIGLSILRVRRQVKKAWLKNRRSAT